MQLDNSKKIVWFNGTLEQSGGGERLSLEVARCINEMGHKAYYVVYFYDKVATFEGRYDYINPVFLTDRLKKIKNPFLKIMFKVKRLFWLTKTLRQIQPDYILTSGTWDQAIEIYLSTRFSSLKYYTHVFGSMFAFTPEKETLKFASVFKENFEKVRQSSESYKSVIPATFKSGFFNELKAKIKFSAIRGSELIYVLSERNRWEIQQLYNRDAVVLKGAFPKKIFDYKPKINLKKKFSIQDKKVILSVGRLAENKRVDLAIKSFYELAKKRNDVDLVIGGTGPEDAKLKKLVQELCLNDRVHFIGYVDENVLWDYFAGCDVFLHLDLADFDIAPLEALAMGANVIWTEEMDLAELTSKLNTIWSVKPNVAAIAHALEKALAQSRSDVNQTVLKDFTWESYTTKMVESMIRER